MLLLLTNILALSPENEENPWLKQRFSSINKYLLAAYCM